MTDIGNFNPFPGLRAFEEDEEFLFFGRERQINELLEKLEHVHFLAVVGASGSGKSSLVKSGLLPSFHSGFMKGVGSGWRIGVMRPGDNPIGNLAELFCGEEFDVTGDDDQMIKRPIIETILRRSDNGIQNVTSQFFNSTKENILIVVDQFEELFRFSKYEKRSNKGTRDSVAFINLILSAVKDLNKRVYVVITMRSDYLGHCTEFRGLPEAINEGQYLIPRMTREERKLAITGPIAVGGGSITRQLLTMVSNEINDNPDQLPIMQHALMRTWDYWQKNAAPDEAIDIKHYRAIGKMDNALSKHAEEAYNELRDEKTRFLCSKMFKALTDVGTNQGGIRRPSKLGELMTLCEASKEDLIEIIDVFRARGRSFLMPPIDQELSEDDVIDISHESLMRVWKRLNVWVKEEAESAETYRSIAHAAALNQEGRGGLYRDPELQIANQWREKVKPNEAWAMRYDPSFVRAMNFLDRSKEEFDFEIFRKENEQRKRIKRTQLFTIVLSIAFLVSTVFMFSAVINAQRAEEASDRANMAKEEALKSKSQAEIEAENARIAEGIAKAQTDTALIMRDKAEDEKQRAERESERANKAANDERLAAAQAKMARNRAELMTEKALQAEEEARNQRKNAIKLKNQALAKTMAFEAISLIDQKKYKQAQEKAIEAWYVNDTSDGPEHVINIYTALSRSYFEGNENQNLNVINQHKDEVRSLSVHPVTGELASIDQSGHLVFSKMTENHKLEVWNSISLGERARSLEFSPDGEYLSVGLFSGEVRVYPYGNAEISTPAKIDFQSIISKISWADFQGQKFVLVSTFDGIKAASFKDGLLTEINLSEELSNLKQVLLVKGSNKVVGIRGSSIVIGDVSERNQVWQYTVQNEFPFSSEVSVISNDMSGQYLGIGLNNGEVWSLDLKTMTPSKLTNHKSRVSSVEIFKSHNQYFAISSGYDKTIYIIDPRTLLVKSEEMISIQGSHAHSSWVLDAKPSLDGNYIFAGDEDHKVKFWFVSAKDIIEDLKKENQ